MALKPCRECGKEISTEAAKCPHCGAPVDPNARRNVMGATVLALIVLALVAGKVRFISDAAPYFFIREQFGYDRPIGSSADCEQVGYNGILWMPRRPGAEKLCMDYGRAVWHRDYKEGLRIDREVERKKAKAYGQ